MENETTERDLCRPEPACRQRSKEPSLTYTDVYSSYRQLLHSLSIQLTQDNLEAIGYLKMVPEQVLKKGHLAVLRYLDQRGEIVWNRTESLHALLEEITRLDLAHSHLRVYEMTLERYVAQEERKNSSLAGGPSQGIGSRTMSDSIIAEYHCDPSTPTTPEHSSLIRRHKSAQFEGPILKEYPTAAGMCPEHCAALLNLSDEMLGQLKRNELIKYVSHAGCSASQLQQNQAWEQNPISSNESMEQSDSGVADDWLEISSEDVLLTASDEPVKCVTESTEPKQNADQEASAVSKTTHKIKACLFGMRKCHRPPKFLWGMCVRDLLPKCSSQKGSKLISKSFQVRCATVPDIKLQLTIQPWGVESEVKSAKPMYTALEVTVIKPSYHYRCAQLHLELGIVMQSGKKIDQHRISHPLQSFFIPQFVSHESLQQLPSSEKLSVHILACVIPDQEFEFVNKGDSTVDCTCLH